MDNNGCGVCCQSLRRVIGRSCKWFWGYCSFLARVGNEFLGVESDMEGSSIIAFPILKQLTFWAMNALEEWDFETAIKGEIIIMPRLSFLLTQGCPKLKALPDHLLQKTTLQSLGIAGCPILKVRYRKETGED